MATADAHSDEILANLTIEEKIGQLVLAALPGPNVDQATAARLRALHFGGVVLFSRNIIGIEQTRALTTAISDCLTIDGLPPLIGVDQEGGRVQRLIDVGTSFPSAMALGATHNPALVQKIGQAIGYELRVLGINTNFAPVADVNNNPRNPVIGTRSFGEATEQVGAMVVAFATGLRAAGVAATAKHFPGHGDTQVDSHLDLPTIPHDLARLRAVELMPFQAAIAAGVPLVMTTHIRFPALEPDGLPATLSSRILNGLLRDEMGYEGIIITDAMMMRAIDDYYGIVAGSVQAIIAGHDLVEPFRHDEEIVAALLDAARDGRLPMAQLDGSVRRILRLKRWLGSQPAPASVDRRAHETLVRAAAEASVTLLDARPGILPIAPDASIAVIEFALGAGHGAEEVQRVPTPLTDAFARRFPDSRGVVLDAVNPSANSIAGARARASEADTLIIGTRDANLHSAQHEAIVALRETNDPTIFVSLRAPYDLADVAASAALLATYGDHPASLDVAAAICAGAFAPRGHLPVRVGTRYPAGHGMTVLP